MRSVLAFLRTLLPRPRWPVHVRGFVGPCHLRGEWIAPTGRKYILVQPFRNPRTYAVEPARVRR